MSAAVEPASPVPGPNPAPAPAPPATAGAAGLRDDPAVESAPPVDLAAWLDGLRAWLAEIAQPDGPARDLPDLRLPSLEQLGRLFGLGTGERLALALLVAQELDTGCARALQELGARVTGRPWLHAALLRDLLPAVVPLDLLAPSAPLRHWRLLELAPAPGPGLTQAAQPWRLDERILYFLIGRAAPPDARLLPFLRSESPSAPLTPSQAALAGRIVGLWAGAPHFLEFPVIELRGTDAGAARALAWQAARGAGFAVMELAAVALPSDHTERHELARLWQREALLARAILFLDATALGAEPASGTPASTRCLPEAIRHWISLSAGGLILASAPRFAPLDLAIPVEIPPPNFAEKRDLIEAFTEVRARGSATFASRVAMQFELGAGALFAACRNALARGPGGPGETPPPFEHALWQACREEARPRLGALVQRVESRVSWDDLVLPAPQLDLLREAARQVKHRARVYQEWGFAEKGSRGLNITALFSGPSGSGKSLAAEVIANDLDLDLLRVDLSATVSKYIGETEANLREIFDAADAGGAVLLFDESDALFGRRSEVKDSHDRHANMEISYLLQRLETYRGLAILTTNFREVIDPAFLRRIRFLVEFPFPDQATRRLIWQRAFPPRTPVRDLDLDRLARLSLAGGNIRNIALNAAFLAAETGEPVSMAHLQRAAETEFAKIDKPTPQLDLRALHPAPRDTCPPPP